MKKKNIVTESGRIGWGDGGRSVGRSALTAYFLEMSFLKRGAIFGIEMPHVP